MTNKHKRWAAALILWGGIIVAPVQAQEQEDNSILAEGPRLRVARENGVSAWKFISRTGSVALVHFRKHNNEDAFAVHVTDWDTFHIKSGWLYFSRTALSFESDDDKQRNFQVPLTEVKKVKGQKDYRGWNYLVIKIGGKEKKFMINFDPVPPSRTGFWGAHQKPVFDLIERLFTDYDGVSRDFQERFSKLQKEPDATTANAPAQTAAALPSPEANIEITSEPSGSEIYVDGVFNSSTPSRLSLAIGEHFIRVSRPGFKDWERRVVVDATSSKTLNAILEKIDLP